MRPCNSKINAAILCSTGNLLINFFLQAVALAEFVWPEMVSELCSRGQDPSE